MFQHLLQQNFLVERFAGRGAEALVRAFASSVFNFFLLCRLIINSRLPEVPITKTWNEPGFPPEVPIEKSGNPSKWGEKRAISAQRIMGKSHHQQIMTAFLKQRRQTNYQTVPTSVHLKTTAGLRYRLSDSCTYRFLKVKLRME